MTERLTAVTGRVFTGETEPLPVEAGADPAVTSRRRSALRCLGRFSYPVELHTLAVHVVAMREDVPTETVSDDARERMAVKLHHIDIPVLRAADLVSYDSESRMVVRTAADIERKTDISRTRQSDAAVPHVQST